MRNESVPCPRCQGKGQVKCDECGGRGYITCPTCGGSKTVHCINSVSPILIGIITILIAVALCVLSAMGGAGVDTVARDLGTDTRWTGLLSGVLGGAILSVLAILYGGGLAITLYAAGEAVYLLLALEENTRATAMALQQRSAEPPSGE